MSKQFPGGLITKSPVTPSGPYSTDSASGIWTLDQQAYWQKLGQWPNANNPPLDPQFNYVTMLLHGDGTNGAQNNTFLDSSTNNFTITRNGNTTQGSFSPYGSNWSNYFNGSTDYLSLGTSTNLALGAGDFTIEVWLSVTAYNASTSNIFEWRSAGGTPSNIPTLYLSASGVPIFYASVGAGALITGSSAVALNTWTHLAIVRSGSTVTMYLNGTSVGSATNSANLGTQSFYINDPQGTYRHNGYFSNVRMVKGTAVYTSAFTPSTTPLTAITNTQLLTCQSNRFIDNSTNAFAITVNGTPSVQRFNPFGTSTAYSTSVIGGSGYFDGSGDYLVSPASSSYQFAGDFTIEYWANLSVIDGVMPIGQTYTGNNFQIYYSADGSIEFGGSNLGLVSTSAGVIVKNSWHHGALVRSGSTVTLYINGVSRGTITSSSTVGNNATIGIGARPNNAYNCTGYISNVRLVSSAVYTTTFTPPTTPFTAISGTVLLLSTTNGAIFDNAMMNDLETVGNAQISTSVKKYGTGSLAFDGTGDYLVNANSINLAFNTGNFTIEGWFNRTSGSNNGLFQLSTTAGGFVDSDVNNLAIGVAPTDLTLYANNSTTTSSTVSITNGTWNHFALVRSGTTTTLYYNGVSVLSLTDSKNYTGTYLVVGGYYTTTYVWNGYIDDFRITKGYARYTANFTPPTAAFFNYGPT